MEKSITIELVGIYFSIYLGMTIIVVIYIKTMIFPNIHVAMSQNPGTRTVP